MYGQSRNLLSLSLQLTNIVNSSDHSQHLNLLSNINIILNEKSRYIVEEYQSLAGSSGSLIKILENKSCLSQCHIEVLKALHYLTYVDLDTINSAKQCSVPVYPSEVTSTIQRIVISILRQSEELSFPEEELMHLYISCLGILYNLIICVPEEVLGNIVLNASHPYAFYKLPGIKELNFFEVKSEENPQEDQFTAIEDTSSRSYTNRNRRKRLRRKKAQPTRSVIAKEPSPNKFLERTSFMPSTPHANKYPERTPFIPSTPPSAQSLSSLNLKPQWLKSSGSSFAANTKSSINTNLQLENVVAELHLNSNFPASSQNSKEPLNKNRYVPSKKMHSNSFSEYNHIESEREKMMTIEAKVRSSALRTINAVVDKAGKCNKFGFWPQLMCQTPSLMTCILRDPSPVVRMSALQIINTFLIDSQQVLHMAIDDEAKGPYTTLGRQLGSSIRELHRCLALALLSERSSSSLVRILKTFELLLENVKYSNLKPGLLTKVVTHVKYFLRYKDAVVRANAFSVMVSFLMVKPKLKEIEDLLTKYRTNAPQISNMADLRASSPCFEELTEEDYESFVDEVSEDSVSSDSCTDEAGEESMISWIVQRCVDSLLLHKKETIHGIFIQVQLQSLKVLSALVSEHFKLIKCNLPLIQHVILECCALKPLEANSAVASSFKTSTVAEQETNLDSSDPEVVIEHAYLLLGSLLGSVKSQIDQAQNCTNAHSEDSCVSPETALQLWFWTLKSPLKVLFDLSNSDDCSVKNYPLKPLVAAANILSHLCLPVVKSIGEEMLNQVLKIVHYLLSHKIFQLKLSGIRIMAIIVSYSPVGENPFGPSLALTTIDTTSQLLSPECKNVNKDRLLASWAVANVFSSLKMYRETAQNMGIKIFVEKEKLIRVIQLIMSGCKDKDKIKPHCVRCLGYIIAYIGPDLAHDPDIERHIEEATISLINCCVKGNNMRMRWNACHALGNILTNPDLEVEKSSWRSSVLVNLSFLVEHSINYKVRIQACSAICNLSKRESFGSEFAVVLKALIKSLQDSQNIPDYQEIQHRDELIHQLCLGVCQLTCLLELDDIENVTECLILHQDVVKDLLKKTHESLPPEQVTSILKATEKIEYLNNSDVLTSAQSRGLSAFSEIFNNFI